MSRKTRINLIAYPVFLALLTAGLWIGESLFMSFVKLEWTTITSDYGGRLIFAVTWIFLMMAGLRAMTDSEEDF